VRFVRQREADCVVKYKVGFEPNTSLPIPEVFIETSQHINLKNKWLQDEARTQRRAR
jgi:hypothetical protein